ncbi:MASE1 domain-containing protein [uncultured Streptomyces sp.]|uniref:MASE1 domain-containing protein n=1 Tax=uncultured Streptomyces sp. TaxID=174707 RepID=UPI00342E81E8
MPSEKPFSRSVYVMQVLGVAVAYYLSGRLGLLRQVVVDGSVVTPLWPPTGVALGALLLLGGRIWPAIALGALCAVYAAGGSFHVSNIGVLAGNTLAPLCAYGALRAVGFRKELARFRDGVTLVFLGAFAGMLVSATLGTLTLLFSDKLPSGLFWQVWACWWAGDVMGVLVITPLLLVAGRFRLPQRSDRWVEASLLAVVAVVVTVGATQSPLSMLYTVFPVLVWAALRFQLPGSAPFALLVSVLAVVAGTDRAGPFESLSGLEMTLNLAVLNGCVTLTSLLLSAMVTEHNTIVRETEYACEELAALVEQLSPLSAGRRRAGEHGGPNGSSLR